jgi:hypothetical protein
MLRLMSDIVNQQKACGNDTYSRTVTSLREREILNGADDDSSKT